MRKSGKWGLAETPSVQFPFKLREPKCTHPTYQRPVYKSAPRTLAASTNRSEDMVDFPQKSRFLGVFRRCFSRLSPHPGQPGKSHLLSILIIYRYIHAWQVSGKSYGNFRRSVLKSLIIGIVWAADCWGLGEGPYPLLDCQSLSKRDGHLGKDSVAKGFGRYFRRKAGGPARLRSASVVQSCFILDGFPSLSDVRRSLHVARITQLLQRTTSFSFD